VGEKAWQSKGRTEEITAPPPAAGITATLELKFHVIIENRSNVADGLE